MVETEMEFGNKRLIDIKSHEHVWKWMTPDPLTISPQGTVKEAVELLETRNIDGLPVGDEKHRIMGLVTKSRLITQLMKGVSVDCPITDTMIHPVTTIGLYESIEKAYQIPVGRLPVVDELGKVVGILTKTDILHSYAAHLETLQMTQHTAETLNTILESAYEGIAVIDKDGIVTEFNEAYCRIVGKEREEVIGKHVTKVIENTRLHITAKTGIAEKGYIQRIHGQDMVVHRIPIWKGETVVGAIGMLIFEGVKGLHDILERMQELSRKVTENTAAVKSENKTNFRMERIIGRSKEIEAVKRKAKKAAKTPSTVLITGESGTGKEMFANAIHELSRCSEGPFISVNCAAIPEHLLEAELFGYEDGAFTGAKKGGKPGKFEMAHKGTLFLDEIGDMPFLMQSKILRVLQEKEVERVGGVTKRFVDVRIVAATNCHLESMVHDGRFREDLYYRLNIIRLEIPPLRERRNDIPFLLNYHLCQFCERFGVSLKTFSSQAIEALLNYNWPGNVRELVNTVEMLVSLSETDVIEAYELPNRFNESSRLDDYQRASISSKPKANPLTNIKETVMEKEKELILKTLLETNGNKAEAARRLGIERSTLYEKLKKHGITNNRPKIQT
jgi:transcriptional regulator with PAS, ATPase and Fis domain